MLIVEMVYYDGDKNLQVENLTLMQGSPDPEAAARTFCFDHKLNPEKVDIVVHNVDQETTTPIFLA